MLKQIGFTEKKKTSDMDSGDPNSSHKRSREDKLQGYLPDYPGNPLFQNGAMTSNVTGNLKTFSSNELAYFSLLFLGIGMYGNAQFLFFDPQWAKVDAGENFNVSYIVESLFLPISFFLHIAAFARSSARPVTRRERACELLRILISTLKSENARFCLGAELNAALETE